MVQLEDQAERNRGDPGDIGRGHLDLEAYKPNKKAELACVVCCKTV